MLRGAVSDAQQQHKPHWPTRRATGTRAAVRTAWRLPARRRVRDGGREGAIGRERVEEVVEFGRRRDVLREKRLPRRRRAPRRHDGRRRRLDARCCCRRAEHGVRTAVQRAPQHESWLVERRGGRRRGGALSVQCASSSAKKYLLCARQSGSSGAGVTALEREPTTKRQRDPPFPRAARNFKYKMTPNPLPPAKIFARERANHHPRSLCERRVQAAGGRTRTANDTTRVRSTAPTSPPRSNGGLELPVSVHSATALRAHVPASSSFQRRHVW